MAIDFDAYEDAQYNRPDRESGFYCADMWCDGHSLQGQRCIDPLDNTDDETEEVCP